MKIQRLKRIKHIVSSRLLAIILLLVGFLLTGSILVTQNQVITHAALAPEEPATYTVDMSAYERVSESSPDVMRVPYNSAGYGSTGGFIEVLKTAYDGKYYYSIYPNDEKLSKATLGGYALENFAFPVNSIQFSSAYTFEYYAPEYYRFCARRGNTINYYDGETLIKSQSFGGEIVVSKYLKNGIAPISIEIFKTGKSSTPRRQIETANNVSASGGEYYTYDVYFTYEPIEYDVSFNYNGHAYNKIFTEKEITLSQALFDEIEQNINISLNEYITGIYYTALEGDVNFELGDTIDLKALASNVLQVKTTAYPKPTEKPLTVKEDFLQESGFYLHNPFDASEQSPSIIRVTMFGNWSPFPHTRDSSIEFTKYTLPLGGYTYITNHSTALSFIETTIMRVGAKSYYKNGYTLSHDFDTITIENEDYWIFKDSRTYQKNELYYSSVYEIGIHLSGGNFIIEYKQGNTLLYQDKVGNNINYTFKDIRKDKFYAPTLLYYATRNGVTEETTKESILNEILTSQSGGASAVYTVQLDYVRLPYDVTFIWGMWFNGLQVNWWQTETIKVTEGDTPTPPPAPNLSGTEWAHIAFIGWDKPLAPVTEDTVYKVVVKEITFDVTYNYLNSKGESVTHVKQTLKGRKPIDFSLNDEIKDPLLYFYFDSWDSTEPIQANKTITARYKYYPLVRFRQVLGSSEVKTYDLDFTEYSGLYSTLPKIAELPQIADFVAWKEFSGSNLPSGYKGYISYPKSENFELNKITFTYGDKTIDKQIDVDLSNGKYYYIFNAADFTEFLGIELKKYNVSLSFGGADVALVDNIARLNFDGNTPQAATLTTTKIPTIWDNLGSDWKNAFKNMGNGFKSFGGWVNKYYTNLSSGFKKVWGETLNLSKNIGTLANKLLLGAGKIIDGVTGNSWVIIVLIIGALIAIGVTVFLIIKAKNGT